MQLKKTNPLGLREHGDARRAIGLLRAAAEIAGAQGGCTIAKEHVDAAMERLQKERVTSAFLSASYHLQMACLGLARVTFLAPEIEWCPTSILYRQYCNMLPMVRPLGYRRASDLLGELENQGIVVSRAVSGGRHGYGRQYRLTVPPEAIGSCFPEFWEGLQNDRERYLGVIRENEYEVKYGKMQDNERMNCRIRAYHARNAWKRFVDL